jgi:cell pole-organizing protein PopZ
MVGAADSLRQRALSTVVSGFEVWGRDYGMSQTAKAQEPSMEEILASIRRIISDEDTGKTAKPPEPAAPKPWPPPPPVATPAASEPPWPPAPPPPAGNGQRDIDAMLADLNAPPPEPAPELAEPAAAPPMSNVLGLTEANVASTPQPGPAPSFPTIDSDPDVVFSDQEPEPRPGVAEDAHGQFAQALDSGLISNATVAAVNSAFNTLAHTVLGQNARTLEDLVKEMLRPLLKSWLDDNLPGIVERIVRSEIERVSRGKP